MIFAVIMEVFCGVIASFLPDYWSFTTVRMFVGISVGGVMVIGFVILMEYAGNKNRDVISALYQVPFTIGHMLLAIFGYFIRDYMTFQLVTSMTNVILLFYICILPETPRWLLAVNKTEKAINVMKTVAKINKRPIEDIERQIEVYQMEHKSSRQKKGFYVLYCPVLYLMFLNHKLYRHAADVLFAFWEMYPVGLFQWIFRTRLHHYGDYVYPDEKTIIVLNHRTRVDWNYIWLALYHATRDSSEDCTSKKTLIESSMLQTRNTIFNSFGGKSKIKFVLKDEIKVVPGIGWIMQLNYFLYVKRNWREDQISVKQFVDYYRRHNYAFRLIIFPEGTDLSEENRQRNKKYVEFNNLPQYDYLLYPRTTGWVALCAQLRNSGSVPLASVYDVTVAYDRPAQTEMDLLRGRMPKHVYFFFKRYAVEDLQCEEEGLKSWLTDRWRDKEVSLRKFYKDGTYIDPLTNKAPVERTPKSLRKAKVAFILWTLIDVIFTYSIIYSLLFQFWVIYHSLLFMFVTWYFGGFQNIQYKLAENYYKIYKSDR